MVVLDIKPGNPGPRMKGQRDRLLVQRLRILFSNHSSYHIKLLVFVVILLSTALLARRASTLVGWKHRLEEPQRDDQDLRQRYTVLVNTWKREDLLKKSVAHYASCKGVDAFRVVWSEPEPPSDELHLSLLETIARRHRRGSRAPELHFDVNLEDNLNNRFKPITGLNTDAVFSVDDDVLVSCDTMELAFNVWLSARDSMVGFVPRMHWLQSKGQTPTYRYGGWWSVWWTGSYSMVLSKIAFFHSKYLELYTYQMPQSIRSYVANERNCEDIAMSFLVANVTKAPPIWVKGRVVEIGSSGISSLTGHSHRRSRCLNHFVTLFEGMPLVPSSVKAVNSKREWFW
ncbi:glycosyltransferase family 64 protein C4 [Selaginella moellendorffii]|uniref:glycosyltransferase family 64 protein C4 n=1 Tax=Selaginella moellendorffii TaxID=88036 RepID=UPI000D1CEF1C|nr:glycosyltransferase family 64 protein C4 [Selaginella moellendorffii]|eukprot:XP_002964004.2 glycosyltransferase family 64 protein C4 [Selaginella moellendorffii]